MLKTHKDMDPILDKLNEEQRRAVLAKEGPVLIIAGAGSGKTRVLTSRIALLLRNGADPHTILALTFTKKAAGEMRERIRALSGPAAGGLVMGTFHSVFVRFLREYHAYIGFPPSFTIYDAEDAQNCLRDCIGEVLFGPLWNSKEVLKTLSDTDKKERKRLFQVYKVKEVASRISLLKNDYVTPKDYDETPVLREYDEKKGRPLLGEIYGLYMRRCRRAGAMDFDDILVYMRFLLDRYPDAARNIATRFRYILVDEYQDTNAIQYDIVRILSMAWGNICAVGDDSQSIYAFRGARIQNILNFKLDYPDHRTFKLETNYRSTPEIVEAANRLIENNENRLPKRCHAFRAAGRPIDIQFLRNDREEARFIARSIERTHDTEGLPWSANAVLYRTNAQARALEDALIRARIPYTIYSGMSFFERQEVKDVLAYLRLVVNHNDDEAFKRICNRPSRGISEATLTSLAAEASRKEASIWATATSVPPTGDALLKPNPAAAVREFTGLVERLSAETKELDALEAAKAILEASGLYAYYEKEKDDDGRKRTNNIDELMNGIRYYVEDQRTGDTDDLPDESLAGYLENIALLSAADRGDSDSDSVSLMTSHCSKGLEFPTVYVAGCEEGLYPSLRSDDSDAELEEERRLFYVSVTRAKDRLVLTSCEERWRYGDSCVSETSRFIGEMCGEEGAE